jgi:Ser/Thr protein kinase RdoA (MazF antagonist)
MVDGPAEADAALTRRGQVFRMRDLAKHALALYGIEPASLSLLAHFYHTTFKVTGTDGARYVLHILRPEDEPITEERSRARVRSELWWLDRLRQDLKLVLPQVERTPGGEGVVSAAAEGLRPRRCTLFRWIEGRFLFQGLAPVHLEAVGRLTARLHEHSESLTVPSDFDRPGVDTADEETEESLVRLFGEFSAEAAATMRKVMRRVRDVQGELGTGRSNFGIIHADIHQKNYLFNKGQVGLIDFGDCGWGYHLYDFAVTINETSFLPRGRALRAALLDGYRRVRDLSADDEARIDSFVMLRRVQDLTWFLGERDNPSLKRLTAGIGERVRVLQRMLLDGG